jgi:hypothetical protein
MFNFELLDIGIGLAFVYLLLSLICSAVSEMTEGWLKKRASDLERGLRELLNDPGGTGLVSKLYDHPLVSGLFKGRYDPSKITNGRYPTGTTLPSYIPSRNFALALMDLVLPASAATPSGATGATAASGTPATVNALQPLRNAIATIQNPQVEKALMTLLDAAGDDIAKARENIEAWYDSAMERVSGWYKRYSQVIIFILGFVVAGLMNADTVSIARALSTDAALRSALVNEAQEYTKVQASGAPMSVAAQEKLKKADEELRKLRLPLGWGAALDNSGSGWLLRVVGWLLTAIAISLGAPFWFDLLNKFMSARSAMKPEEAPKKA